LKLTVTGRHVALTDSHRQLIRRKLRRLERVLNDSAVSAQCIVALEKLSYVCEVTVHARGDHMLHAVARHARLITAVNAAVDKVRRQGKSLADRWKARRRARG
jgi:ribosomal subunit interface protein